MYIYIYRILPKHCSSAYHSTVTGFRHAPINFVYMCMYLHIYIYTNIYVCVCACKYYIYIFMCVYVYKNKLNKYKIYINILSETDSLQLKIDACIFSTLPSFLLAKAKTSRKFAKLFALVRELPAICRRRCHIQNVFSQWLVHSKYFFLAASANQHTAHKHVHTGQRQTNV